MKEREKQRKKYKEFKKQEINKRFFNFSRLEKHFGIFSLYMILGKKNIGKTTLFINLMKELERKNEFGKILYLRLEDKEAREVRGE
jgi:predicted AAA+ superfamily ATPase